MSAWTQSNDQLRREKFWRTPPPDPTKAFRKSGVPYYRPGKNRVLMPDDFMPLGPHAGKHLRAVPPDYLLWVHAQDWSKNWVQWRPVADFIDRFITSDPETEHRASYPTTPVIFVDPIQQQSTSIIKCFQAGSSHLNTLPGHLDLLQTFGIGALALNPDWLQHRVCPHFDLTIRKHQLAIQCGAIAISRAEIADHIDQWRQFRDSQPKPIQ